MHGRELMQAVEHQPCNVPVAVTLNMLRMPLASATNIKAQQVMNNMVLSLTRMVLLPAGTRRPCYFQQSV
jgi:hypothetical protein